MSDSTRRFSSRVDNYVKYRPSYPPAIIELLANQCGLTRVRINEDDPQPPTPISQPPGSDPQPPTPISQPLGFVVADIGAGTGLLAELFLKNGNRVLGIEPNREMREAGERLLAGYPHYTGIDGTAEATTLDDSSVDLITAGQAFHWFDREKSRAEFARILRPDGWVALVWNERRVGTTPFLEAYERLLRTYAGEYATLNHRQVDQDTIAAFFAAGSFRTATFENRQVFDFEGVKGRLLSSSYTPEPGHPQYQPMLDELAAMFRIHQSGGTVTFEYDTNVYYGQLLE